MHQTNTTFVNIILHVSVLANGRKWYKHLCCIANPLTELSLGAVLIKMCCTRWGRWLCAHLGWLWLECVISCYPSRMGQAEECAKPPAPPCRWSTFIRGRWLSLSHQKFFSKECFARVADLIAVARDDAPQVLQPRLVFVLHGGQCDPTLSFACISWQ